MQSDAAIEFIKMADSIRQVRIDLERAVQTMNVEIKRFNRLVETMKLIRDSDESECFARGAARVALAEYELQDQRTDVQLGMNG